MEHESVMKSVMSISPAQRLKASTALRSYAFALIGRFQKESKEIKKYKNRGKSEMRNGPKTIKAIPTEYGGTLYRSRLEARWAAQFDALGIEFAYEPQGYEFQDGMRYLPDFWFPELNMFGEAKGVPDASRTSRTDAKTKFDGKQLVVTFPKQNEFAFQAAQRGEVVELLSEGLKRATGSNVALKLEKEEKAK